MKRTTEKSLTKMLSVRVERELYWQLKHELQMQLNPETKIGHAVYMSALIKELLRDQLWEREQERLNATIK